MTSCDFCRKKASLISFNCKCGKTKLCTKCRLPESHNCEYDYNTIGKKELEISMPKIIGIKINKI